MIWAAEWRFDRDLQLMDSVPVGLAVAGSLSVLCVNQQRTRRCAQVVGDTRGDETSPRRLQEHGDDRPAPCAVSSHVRCRYRNRWSLRY